MQASKTFFISFPRNGNSLIWRAQDESVQFWKMLRDREPDRVSWTQLFLGCFPCFFNCAYCYLGIFFFVFRGDKNFEVTLSGFEMFVMNNSFGIFVSFNPVIFSNFFSFFANFFKFKVNFCSEFSMQMFVCTI